MNKLLIKAVSELQEDEAMQLVQQALGEGEDPLSIIADCQEAMKVVGNLYAKGDYFLPELIMSGEVVKNISDVLKPRLQGESIIASGGSRKGAVVIGTVRGDIHNIGKDMVSFMLDINGFEVHDLGVNVPEEKFVQAIKEVNPPVVAMSGLLTAIYDSMQSTVEAIRKAGLRDRVKIMIGGGQIDEIVKNYVGADAYGKDAMSAVLLAEQWMPEK